VKARAALAVAVTLLLAACGGAPSGSRAGLASGSPSSSPASPASPSPAGPPDFQGTIQTIPAELASSNLAGTWHPGCPVPISELRLLTLGYWGFDGVVHQGPMVVNAAVASKVVWAFRQLFAARFPIQEMALSTKYDPSANPNTRTNITASFNCRPIVTPNGPGTSFSMHASGLAIDINPLLNPFVGADGTVLNRFSRPYRDRSLEVPGMIHAGDVVVRALAHIGWSWGGDWTSGQDYMHFSSTGT
jgi:hypothetical protein